MRTRTNAGRLPPAAVDAVHRIVNDATRLTNAWYERTALAEGMSDSRYVELVGTVVSVCEHRPLLRRHRRASPRSAGAGAGGTRAATARPPPPTTAGGWAPMVPFDNSGTPEADLWAARRTGNVIRALSLAPDEVRTLNDLGGAHYIEHHLVRDPSAQKAGSRLSRVQIELVAGRVSVLNDCFY